MIYDLWFLFFHLSLRQLVVQTTLMIHTLWMILAIVTWCYLNIVLSEIINKLAAGSINVLVSPRWLNVQQVKCSSFYHRDYPNITNFPWDSLIKKVIFIPFPVIKSVYIISNTYRKVYIPVKLSYKPSLCDDWFLRYDNLAESDIWA